MDIVDHDGRLRGEDLQQRLLPVVEGVDLSAEHGDASNDFVVKQHRRRHRAPDAALLLHVAARVLGVGEHVADLLDPAFDCRASEHRAAVHLHREVGHGTDELLRQTDGGRQPEGATLNQVDRGGVAAAEPRALSTTVSSTASGSEVERPSATRTSLVALNCSVASA